MALWKTDPKHSEVIFKVKHLVVSTATGHFNSFDASIESGKEDFSDAKIAFETDVNSVNTKNDRRDDRLKSPDFFDTANYPTMSFVSMSVKKASGSEFKVAGNLTLRGVTKEISLDVIYNGTAAGFGGTQVAGFEIGGKLNCFDFGLQWSALTETGVVVVSNRNSGRV
jgi:polyisoprenoid-binding protein YceI